MRSKRTVAGSRGDDMLKPLIGTSLAGSLRRIGSCPGHRSSFVRPGLSTIPLRPLIERIIRRCHHPLFLILPRGEGTDLPLPTAYCLVVGKDAEIARA
jgi:hypothetical protein